MALCHYLYRYQYNVLHLCNIFIIQYTFAYSAIADWNSLPNNVKTIKNENKYWGLTAIKYSIMIIHTVAMQMINTLKKTHSLVIISRIYSRIPT